MAKKRAAQAESPPEILEIPKKKPELKRTWKGHAEYTHDLYKLQLATFMANSSYKRYQPILAHIEHVHMFHSVDRRGRPLDKCSPVGGHFHYITTEVGEDGTPRATCSKPKQFRVITMKNGKQKKVIQDISFEDEKQVTQEGDFIPIVDDHVHEVKYVHSEVMSEAIIKNIQTENQAKIKSLTEKAVMHNRKVREEVNENPA